MERQKVISVGQTAHGAAQQALVVARDAYFLAADKPAGLLVHGDGTGAATLTDQVTAYLRAHGSDAVPQAVQRLDVPTTGLVLYSLDKATQPAFDALVAGHDMRKRYLAVVSGVWPARPQVIDAPIGRDRHDSRRMRVSRTGKPARTRVELLERRGPYSLLLVELLSGRKHQIRVHLASRGFPIVGDGIYGGRANAGGLMLHAWREEFDHPITGERVALETVWPERFSSLGFHPRLS